MIGELGLKWCDGCTIKAKATKNNCDNCGAEGLLRKCSRCGKKLCPECVLIEEHECLPISKSWGSYAAWQKKLRK